MKNISNESLKASSLQDLSAILEHSQIELDVIYQNAPLVILLVDSDGCVVKMNDRAKSVLQSAIPHSLGMRLGEVLSCKNSQFKSKKCGGTKFCKDCPVRKLVEDTFKQEKAIYQHKVEFTRKLRQDDAVVSLLISTAFMDFPTSKQVLLYIEDVTKTETIAKEVNEERIRSDRILRATDAGTWDWDLETNEIILNSRWAEMIGYSLEEILPYTLRKWKKQLHPDDLARVTLVLEEHLSAETAYYDAEFRMCHKEGHWVWIHSRGKVIKRSSSGKALLMSGTHMDISFRKAVEYELLTEKENAESANLAKDEFLSMMSHEMRTPLNPIMGYSDLLRRDLTDPIHLNYLGVIEKSSNRLLKLIDSLLSYTRLKKQVIHLNMEAFCVSQMLKDIFQLYEKNDSSNELFLENGESNRLSYYPAFLEIISDEEIIRQILTNLVTNALKYTSNGKVILRAGLLAENESDVSFRFEVEDTGIGIPKEKIKTIFEPFNQVDTSYTRSYDGVGLGLAICRRLAELLKAKVGVESSLGKGSLFWLEFSAKKNPCTANKTIIKEGKHLSFDKAWRVLIIDEVLENQVYIESCITRLGGFSTVVPSLCEAVQENYKNEYDLILIDVEISKRFGADAVRMIRSVKGRSRIPIVALLPSDQEEFPENLLVDHYLRWPFKMDLFVSVLNKAMKG